MNYLCLVYFDEVEYYARPQHERDALFEEGAALALKLRKHPGFGGADALEPTSAAATVRVRDGQVMVTDGPFAETREQLGGFLLIDAGDLDEALEIAAQIPAARFGSIEIRPVRDIHKALQ